VSLEVRKPEKRKVNEKVSQSSQSGEEKPSV
jgi:hypothetical protein